ncbi:LolA family protein [Sorangium sp. So ce1097]|uniref:LolA family protein n=1 Tax=Sorangium sp. So ce1097 TaxID=3133330 RepID=UPI003F63ED00
MRDRAIACVATLAVLVTGCASVDPPPSRFPTADAALGRMKDTYACVNGVQGTAKIDHFSRQGRIRGDVYILAVNPDRVRFDIVSPFGANLYTLTSDGTLFQMLDVGQKQLLHGPASACNLARLTQVPIPGHALVSLLRGEAPVLVHEPRGASIAWDGDGFYRVLIQSTRDATQEIHLEPRPDDWRLPWSQQRLRVRQVRVAQRGLDLYHAELSHHEVIHTAPPRVDPEGIDDPIPPSGGACQAEIPRSIRMRVPNTEDDVIFQYKDAKWNPPLVSGAFTQPVPGGVIRRYVDCQD